MLVSVIIPTLNEARGIQRTLAAARRAYGLDEVEILVVDGGSTDGTLTEIQSPDVLVRSPAGRAVQMNRGAATAQGEILVFCHADTHLPPGWREPVIAALHQPWVSGGSFSFRIVPPRGILHLINLPRYPADWRLMYGDQAQFMRRDTFEMIGGFPEVPAMEDMAIMWKLQAAGELVRLPLRVTTSSRRFLAQGPLRQLILNASVIFRYIYLGATPEEIACTYYGTQRDRENGGNGR